MGDRTGGVFFFQAEDGIRYLTVTGVQTCALPICRRALLQLVQHLLVEGFVLGRGEVAPDEVRRGLVSHHDRARHDEADRKSTRLNSSHSQISYAVFCLKKKKKNTHTN